jgi:broad specificity phosphatase PhoE
VSSLLFVRHGQTEANRTGVLLGRLDPPLNATGREQIAAVAERIAPLAPTRVLSSPLLRARESAGVIGARCGVDVEIDDRLVEVDYGQYDGVVLMELPPDLVRAWRTDEHFAPPGGESLASVQKRMTAFSDEMLATHVDGPVVAVSHVSPIKAAVCWALQLGPLAAWRMRLDNATVTRLTTGPDGPVLASFNEH